MSYQIAYDTARAPPRGAAFVAFMEDFYRTSDTESLHEKYVQSFTEDATLIMGPKEAKGASGMVLSNPRPQHRGSYTASDPGFHFDAKYTSAQCCIPANKTNPVAILTLRHGLWTHVASRRHTPTQIYFGGDNELMLYGGVNYRLKANPDNEVYVPWAGRVVFAPQKGDEDIKMQFYQVYLVSTSLC